MIQPFNSSPDQPPFPAGKTSKDARRAAEALFQSSENAPTASPRKAPQRAIRAQANIVSIRHFVISRLLDQARFSRRLEFVELPRNPGKSTEGERRSPVFLLVFGPEGRTLYVALEDGEAPSAALPAWWERLAMLGHAQRRVRARTAVEAWRLTQICLKKLAIIEG